MRHTRILDTEIDIGPGSLELLPSVVARVRELGNVVVVVGTTVRGVRWSGDVARLAAAINAEIAVLPSGLVTAAMVDSAYESMGSVPGVVVAIGGGRIIDAAKLLAAKWAETDAAMVPIVAVPTTAGSGSELTPFATRWNLEAQRKESVSGERLTPRAAIVDPLLAATCTPAVAASAAVDALSQAIESGWSIRSTPQSFEWSMRAVSLVSAGISDPDGLTSDSALNNLSEGALLAGAAIAIANTTGPHGVSYPLTLEFDLLHGHAVGLTLGRFIRFNAECTEAECEDSRGNGYFHSAMRHILDCLNLPDALRAERWVDQALDRLGLAPLAAFPLATESVATEALSYDRTSNNPRRLDVEGLEKLLRIDPPPLGLGYQF